MTTRPPAAARARPARLALAAVACMALAGAARDLPAPAAGGQQAPVVTRQTCGEYEAVPSGAAANGQPTRLSIQKGGRLLLTVSDWSITRVNCADVDANRTFEFLVTSYSGGAHCCETLHVWALESKPRKLLEYAAGNAGGYELRDLDGDGRQELLLGDDSFAYYGDLCYACSPSSLPMVACRVERGFEDCSARFPEIFRGALARYIERLKPPSDETELTFVEGAALGALAVSSVLGEEDKALESIRAATGSDAVMNWLERARPHVRDWLRARGRRLKDGKQ